MNIRIQGHESTHAAVDFVARVAANGVLCIGTLDVPLGSKDMLLLGDEPARKPYLGTALVEDGRALTALLLTCDHPDRLEGLEGVTIRRGEEESLWRFAEAFSLGAYGSLLRHRLATFSQQSIRRLLFLLQGFIAGQPKLAADPLTTAALWEVRHACTEPDASVLRAHWLLPNVAYLDLRLPYGMYKGAKLVASTLKAQHRAELLVLPVPPDTLEDGTRHDRAIAIALFEGDVRETVGKADLTLTTPDQLLVVEGAVVARPANTAQLLHDLRAMPVDFRQQVREHLCAALLEHRVSLNRFDAAHLVRNLQFYLPAHHTSAVDPQQPFGMNVEVCVPIGNEAVFLAGWMRDPLRHLESVTGVADLGFTFPVTEHLRFFRRSDVDALYEGGPYAGALGAWGFAACVPMVPEVSGRLRGLAELHGFRFRIGLKGGLQYALSPPPTGGDPFALRQMLLERVAPFIDASAPEAEASLHAALAGLQTACMAALTPPRVEAFGPPPHKNPSVSLVIPLYRCLDFLAAQIAHFSNDPSLAQAEFIYVLDSPEQAPEVRERLRSLGALYDLPLTLAVMERNAGYAAASNAGAALAHGELLVLLNSDVLPAHYGWLSPMVEILRRPGVGAVGPMLLYEDGSIQHAGMYFHHDPAADYFLNMHHFKGYPSSYPPARESRQVAALTGACLLLRRATFQKVGGFSTDYIVGDFEDSDLCLTLRGAGQGLFYCADAVLYHLERQSMSLHEDGRANSVHRYNARLHQTRWNKAIAALMKRAA